MNNFMQTGYETFKITKLVLIETRDNYRAIPQRSYNLNASQRTLDKLDEILNIPGMVHGQRSVTDNELAVCVPELISLTPGILGIAHIPNGWGTTRLRFLMETVQDTGSGVMFISYIQGFTDYYDPSLTGLIDPNMKFHINSIVNVTRTIGTTGMPHTRVSSMYNVISDLLGATRFEEVQYPGADTIKLCRPTDITSNLFAISAIGGYDNNVQFTPINNASDTITPYKPATSNRTNNNPYKYMSSTLNALTSTKQATEIGHDERDLLLSASHAIREPDISKCILIDKLLEYRDYVADSPSSFTIGELDMISPGLVDERVILVARDNNMELNLPHTMLSADDTAELAQPSIEATKSAFVANSLTSIMLENLLTRVGFSSTNTAGQPVVVLTDLGSFMDGIEPEFFGERVKTGILNTIVPHISDLNLSTYELFVSADLLGDITIGLKINSNPYMVMRYPAFADSLYTPVVNKLGANQVLINDFQTLIDNSILGKF